MPNNTQVYKIVAADIACDREQILALWSCGLSQGGMPSAKFDWYYIRNPAGIPRAFFLYQSDTNKPVGVAAVSVREMLKNKEIILGGELIDFVTLIEHRTLFPALYLQREIRRRIFEHTHSIELLYGLPNTKSTSVVQRVGYQRVGQMVRRVRMLRSAGYLTRYAPAWLSRLVGPMVDHARLAVMAIRAISSRRRQSKWQNRPDSRFDELWERVAAQSNQIDGLIGVRDSAFLTWRFVECPLKSYEFFTLVSTNDNRLLAYAACAVESETLHVHDFLVDPADRTGFKALWVALSREAFHRGHSNISVECLGSASMQRDLQSVGMLKRQQRPLYASARVGNPTLPQEQHWYITCADEDG